MGPYIPATDLALDDWAANFSGVITSSPTSYGLIAGQASSFATLQAAYTTALAKTTDPSTKTSITIAAKNAAKASMVFLARQLAQVARKKPSISAALLAAAGLTVPDPTPSPIPAPTSKPILSLFDSATLQHSLRFKDSVLVNPRSKPPGAIAMRLYVKIGTPAPASIADCKFLGQFTRMPAVVDFASGDAGKQAQYLAQWVTRTDLTGPVSDLFSATIPA